MKELKIGMIGANYGAYLHCDALQYVGRIPFSLKTLCYKSTKARAEQKKQLFGFERITNKYHEMLADPEIHVVDIVGTPLTHLQMIREALSCGKHVICEKPLTGYISEKNDLDPVGETVPKRAMYRAVLKDMDQLKEYVKSSGKQFYYAENFVYAPSIQRSAEFIRKKKSKILFMNAFFAMKGSSSPLAGKWRTFGGGCWYRNGVHPLGAILWLKMQEGKARGEDILPVSITADMGMISNTLTEELKKYIDARPYDVEDNSTVVITFSDGSKATIIVSDVALGGSQNTLDIYTNDGVMKCKLLIPDELETCFLDDCGLEDLNLSEMNTNKLGWNRVFTTDAVVRGYANELRDIFTAILENRETDLNYEFAYHVMKITYAAYCSAEEKCCFNF